MYPDYLWVVETNRGDGKGWYYYGSADVYDTREYARQRARELRECDCYFGYTTRYRVKKYKRVD